jgi:hypothetical protein
VAVGVGVALGVARLDDSDPLDLHATTTITEKNKATISLFTSVPLKMAQNATSNRHGKPDANH